MEKEIFLCAINNILSGYCGEDCQFCTQSTRYNVAIDRYKLKTIAQIVEEAKIAKSRGAIGYCLVTSGKGLNKKMTNYIAEAATAIKQEIDNINIIGCNGIASLEQLKFLKENGVDSYNHNLEASKNYYKNICTTHAWEERYQTCVNAKEAGLMLCTGGILGMGESTEDRNSLLDSIASLEPESVPLNFFIPNEELPLKERSIELKEGLEIIAKVRGLIGEQALLMIAGGREELFSGKEKEMFDAGANSIVIGDYLTSKGENPNADLKMLKRLNLTVATTCPDFE